MFYAMNICQIAEDANNVPQLVSYVNSACQQRGGKWEEVPRGSVKLLDEIGAGAFGVVYKAQLKKDDGQTIFCAVKTLKGERIKSISTFSCSLTKTI